MPRANIIPKTVQLISELHRMTYAKTLLLAAAFSTALSPSLPHFPHEKQDDVVRMLPADSLAWVEIDVSDYSYAFLSASSITFTGASSPVQRVKFKAACCTSIPRPVRVLAPLAAAA